MGALKEPFKILSTFDQPFFFSNTLRLFKPNQLSVHIGDRLSEVCMANNSVSGSSPAICAETVQVSKIIRHPDFNPVLLDNDIALILLSSPIDLTNKPCACSLCLKEKSPSVDEFCMISGSNGDDEHNFGKSCLSSEAKLFVTYVVIYLKRLIPPALLKKQPHSSRPS